MKRVAALLLSSLLFVGNSSAADVTTVDVFQWTGGYVGVAGGWGSGSGHSPELFADDVSYDGVALFNFGNATTRSRGTLGDLEARGGFFGVHGGYNLQSGPWLFGLEGDVQKSYLSGDVDGRVSNPDGDFPLVGQSELSIDWFGTLRGRFGFALDRMLVYGTGGLAFGNVDFSLSASEDPFASGAAYETSMENSSIEAGFVVGGGAEMAINDRWTVKAEYQYIDLGDVGASAPVTGFVSGEKVDDAESGIEISFHTVRIGIGFRI